MWREKMTEQERERYKRLILEDSSNPNGANRNFKLGVTDRYLYPPEYLFPTVEQENKLRQYNLPPLVDPGIRNALIAINEAGFSTGGSCQGHATKGEGFINIQRGQHTWDEIKDTVGRIIQDHGINVTHREILNKESPGHESYVFNIQSIPDPLEVREQFYKAVAKEIKIPPTQVPKLLQGKLDYSKQFRALAKEQSDKHSAILAKYKTLPNNTKNYNELGKELKILFAHYKPLLEKVAPSNYGYASNPYNVAKTIAKELRTEYGITKEELIQGRKTVAEIKERWHQQGYRDTNSIPKSVPTVQNSKPKLKTTTSVAGIREKYNL
jgi:hypothetical protein